MNQQELEEIELSADLFIREVLVNFGEAWNSQEQPIMVEV